MKRKAKFLRNMSHEFRTPLHAIVSFPAMASKNMQTQNHGMQYFELIQKGAERLSRLVDEVLDMAALSMGSICFAEETDMRELVTRAAEMVRPLLKEKNITLCLRIPGHPP